MSFDVEKDLKFIEQNPPRGWKTRCWAVWNDVQRVRIGQIQYLNTWRHYVFYPDSETVFSDRCLMRIGRFVGEQNEKNNDKLSSEQKDFFSLPELEFATYRKK